MKRELAPKTQTVYAHVLRQARLVTDDGDTGFARPPTDFADWPESRLAMLRSAALDYGERNNRQDLIDFAHSLPRKFAPRKMRRLPTSSEIAAFMKALEKSPRRWRACLNVLLGLGLRSDEFLSLRRAEVEQSLKTGELIFVRKGGDERALPIARVKEDLRALLKASKVLTTAPWETMFEVYSSAGSHAAYLRLRHHVAELGKVAGGKWTPHLLRHIFATQLMRSGAPIPVIQKALSHKHYSTTVKTYVHVESSDLAEYLK